MMTPLPVSVVVFETNLRVHDHEALYLAQKTTLPIIGLYVFPQGVLPSSSHPAQTFGQYRLKFLWDSLIDLREQLGRHHIPLYVLQDGRDVPALFHPHYDVQFIFMSASPGSEEQSFHTLIQSYFPFAKGIFVHDKPLLHPEDYPWITKQLPPRFTDFRIKVEHHLSIRKCFPDIRPQTPMIFIEDDWEKLSKRMPSVPLIIPGGETAARNHLKQYFFIDQHILTYKETRNDLLGFSHSSKLSPALALGLLSIRECYWQLKQVETTIQKNVSTYWLFFEWLWRDFFYYLHWQHGNRFFTGGGIRQVHPSWVSNETYRQAIIHAQTGYPLVDANLRELYQTGWMSNRGRQNVASFISKILRLDWRWGASLFETHLIDYDVSSNYGNWQYLSGVGSDPREERIFNVSLQAKKYDPQALYLKTWLPELKDVPVPLIFMPWTMTALDAQYYHCEIGKDYPSPIMIDRRVQLNG